MSVDPSLATFLLEARDLLEQMEEALVGCRKAEPDAETVNAIFRAAHTIKGAAGLFGLSRIVSFTHAVEGVLDRVRGGALGLEAVLVDLLLSCADHVATLVNELEADGATESQDAAAGTENEAALLAELRRYLEPERRPAKPPAGPAAPQRHTASPTPATSEEDIWHLSLRFGREVFRRGLDPLSFLRFLGGKGTITALVLLPDAIPAPESFDPRACYLGFEVAFRGKVDQAELEKVFALMEDDCQLRIVPPKSRLDDYLRLIEALPEEPMRLGEILAACGSVTADEIEAALVVQRDRTTPPPPLGSLLVEHGKVSPVVVEAALAKQRQAAQATKARESRSVRVDADKLDQLVDLVGELIIATAGTKMVARNVRLAALQDCMATLAGLVESVRDSALQLRMVKIGATFNRFQRVVHDVSKELGKDIRLQISGEETELDKTVVEKMADPLTHLVRNAMDHGIEAPAVRAARGKPAHGTIRLNAFHDGGSIVIEVTDDGGGIPRDKVLDKAIERGLVAADSSLTDDEIFRLIFEPGFSTAAEVTNLSGRGVGMDVVKRNITALRGSVSVSSEEGQGTTVRVRLPLTLAIIDGFLVTLGETVFVVPLEIIEECVASSAVAGHDYANLRGRALPFIKLRDFFHAGGTPPRRESIVVVKLGEQRAGLVVDGLLGETQTVIKPLGKMFSRQKYISGSSILGTGDVALILDVPALVQEARRGRREDA